MAETNLKIPTICPGAGAGRSIRSRTAFNGSLSSSKPLPPRIIAPQPFYRSQVRHCVVLDCDCPAIQVGILRPQGFNFLPLHAGTEKAGGFPRLRQSCRFDLPDTIAPAPSPFLDERIVVDIFLVRLVIFSGVFIPPGFSRIISDIPMDFIALFPYLTAGWVIVTEFFLRPNLVLERTPLVPVGDGGQRLTRRHSSSREKRLPLRSTF